MSEPTGAAGTRPRRLDRVLAPGSADELGLLPLAALRLRRTEAKAEEEDLSYLRRVLHGRIDIIAAESARRRDGDPSPLVAHLSEILADAPPGRAASARHLGSGPGPAGEYRAALEASLREAALPDLARCADGVLDRAGATLAGYEREVSDLRRKVQFVADECAMELARRYRVGEAAIDDLLVAE
jgi:hypothetical protein